jgi:RHS repeat-associated protein
MSVPFSLDYSTAGMESVIVYSPLVVRLGYWSFGNSGVWDRGRQGGWSYSVPTLFYRSWEETHNGPTGDGLYHCDYTSDYTFVDSTGHTHSLLVGTITAWSDSGYSTNPQVLGCRAYRNARLTGGDAQVSAKILTTSDGFPISVPVSDLSGTTYTFSTDTDHFVGDGSDTDYAVLVSVEDRNGNTITGFSSTPETGYPISVTDTAQRAAVSVTGTGAANTSDSIVAGGLQFAVEWNSTTANFALPSTLTRAPGLPSQAQCQVPTATSGTLNTVSTVTLPNGQTYQFFYGQVNPNDSSIGNPYGLLNEIIYPGGGWVKYTYTAADTGGYSNLGLYSAFYTTKAQYQNSCQVQFTLPRVSTRTVSFDGVTVAKTQTFSYGTAWPQPSSGSWPTLTEWTAKSTTVVTADSIRGVSTTTAYSYAPAGAPIDPFATESVSSEIPVESTVVRNDWGGALLDVEYDGWYNYQQKACEFHAPNGSGALSTGHFYTYTNGIVTDDKEYGFGSVSSPASVCDGAPFGSFGGPSAPSGVTPLRETTTTLQSFTNPLGTTFNSPLVVSSYQNGSQIAESDFSYDGASLAGVSAVQHDDTNFPASLVAGRGNQTQIVKKCIGASCTGNPTVTMTYDNTGQLRSKTDACGNASCSDIVGSAHTVNYSYADSGGGGSTYAYLTSTTYPDGRTEAATYNYTTGARTSATDRNGKVTRFWYSDSLNRPTETDFPDGGVSRAIYYDSASGFSASGAIPNANSVKTAVMTTVVQNSQSSKSTLAIADGLGHVVETQTVLGALTDYVDTVYDGMGRAVSVTNPYRFTLTGSVFYAYDALGRRVLERKQDGSYQKVCFNGVASAATVLGAQVTNSVACSSRVGSTSTQTGSVTGTWNDSVDERGNHWQRSFDEAGRLTQVMEPNGTTQAPSMETDYSFDALGDLVSVQQWGGASGSSNARTRSFSYDGLGRLTSASNPEAGVIGYSYDLNSNVSSKTDARGIHTNYQYDDLNRVIAKAYSTGTSGADPTASPVTCYQYDSSAISGSGGNLIGRLTNEWTQRTGTSCNGTAPNYAPPSSGYLTLKSVLSYDAVGRPLTAQQQHCVGTNCAAATPYALSQTYNQAGELISQTNSVGASNSPLTLSANYDGAGQPCLLTSSWSGTFSATIFQSNPSQSDATAGYTGAGNLQNWYLGSTTSSAAGSCGQTPNSPINVTQVYNSRLWTSAIGVSGQLPLPALTAATVYTYSAGYDSAGNVTALADTVDRGQGSIMGTWAYSYDTLNRLQTGTPSAGSYSGQNACWSYDAFGNRTAQNLQSASCPAQESGVAATASFSTSNRVTWVQNTAAAGYTYDASGNVLYDGSSYYAYDAESRICAVQTYPLTGGVAAYGYLYNADGSRVAKGSITSSSNPLTAPLSCDPTANGFQFTEHYVLGLGGEELTMFDGQRNWQRTNVYAAGQLAGTYDASGLHFHITDSLGTRRMQLSGNLATLGVPETECQSLPFGDGQKCSTDSYAPSSADDATPLHFNGKEHDSETGNDYFGARYYGNSIGRFLSPDWSAQAEPVPYAKMADPQSLNLYAYVENNPIANRDIDGHEAFPMMIRNPGPYAAFEEYDSKGSGLSERAEDTLDALAKQVQEDQEKDKEEKQQPAQQAQATPDTCTAVLPSGLQLTMVYTLMGEQTPESAVGTQRYGDDQSGTKPGKPNGPTITDGTLNIEAHVMVGTMLNLGNIGNAGTYTGLPSGIDKTRAAMKSLDGSPGCTQLKRDVDAVQHPTATNFNQWKTSKQGNWVRPLNGGSRIAQNDFYIGDK